MFDQLSQVEEVHHKGARLANVDQHGLSPLHHAARLGRKDVVQYLVSNGMKYMYLYRTCIMKELLNAPIFFSS